jgi:SAM-dependent methyltransferase
MIVTETEFDKFAGSYKESVDSTLGPSGEDSEYFAKGRVDWLRRVLPAQENIRRVMDYGCGIGLGTPHLLTLPFVESIVGVDVSEKSLELAQLKFGYERIRFSSFNEYKRTGEIDLVVCCSVFHHIPPAQRKAAVKFIYDSLKPGGWFAMWEHNPWNPGVVYIMNNSPIDQEAVRVKPHRARRMLRDGGFSIVQTDYLFVFPRMLSILRGMEPAMSQLPFGAQYLVLARKP